MKPIDLTPDPLATAPLTPAQRLVWQSICQEVEILRQKVATIEDGATSSGLMILPRPEFNREVARTLAHDARYGGTSSVIYFACDSLNALGAARGKAVMNLAVRAICDTLLKQVRNCDIVGRLELCEFGVLLARCDNENAWARAAVLAHALQTATTTIQGEAFNLAVGYGVHTFAPEESAVAGLQDAARVLTKAR